MCVHARASLCADSVCFASLVSGNGRPFIYFSPSFTRGDEAWHKHSLKSPAGITWSEINALCMLIAERGPP